MLNLKDFYHNNILPALNQNLFQKHQKKEVVNAKVLEKFRSKCKVSLQAEPTHFAQNLKPGCQVPILPGDLGVTVLDATETSR